MQALGDILRQSEATGGTGEYVQEGGGSCGSITNQGWCKSGGPIPPNSGWVFPLQLFCFCLLFFFGGDLWSRQTGTVDAQRAYLGPKAESLRWSLHVFPVKATQKGRGLPIGSAKSIWERYGVFAKLPTNAI